ncbi:glucokinase [Candidatus Koribacter versatilis Ellin345]|uniref:Glucokinase n=1 Tax=Koribacter versatilis (strain Ellin345) TaxID=204669 RepID=Q1IVU2_KORVE|nr:ROK family protein [Candidatus Koribacter versatilis]ABF39008.1 glucokinase [Candidatus Koribacter versatilis Ellin345]
MIGAVDIGGTKIAVGVVDADGVVIASDECPTEAKRGYADALNRISAMLRACAEKSGEVITGVGIGSTGPVDPLTGEIGNAEFIKEWMGCNPVRDLAERFGVKVAMENDADAAALGEAAWGAGRGRKHMIFVTVGTGIGGGIILGGRLYRGADGAHPEIGHYTMDSSGPLCFCGIHGCWEVLCAGPAMGAWMTSQAPADWPPEDFSAKRICERAREGDPIAKRGVEREAHYLGLGVANLITLFTPEVIVLGGNVMRSADLFMEQIHAEVRRCCTQVPYEKTDIRLASLGPQTGLVGAARVWHHRFRQDGEVA